MSRGDRGDVSARLALRQMDATRFTGTDVPGSRHVFGGLLVGQSLAASAMTLPKSRTCHSLHASFTAAGDPAEPITYDVELTRDGSSFSTRRVVARQGQTPLVVLTADFHEAEQGPVYEPPPPAFVDPPADCAPGRYDTEWFESRDVASTTDHTRRSWFRPRHPLVGDPALHLHALAYLTDHGPTRAARQPHAELEQDSRRQSVSLDHSVWFHQPVLLDDWILIEYRPVATGRGRGLALGSVWTRDGRLVATLAQEVLLRVRPLDPS